MKDLGTALSLFKDALCVYLKKGTVSNYCTFIRTIQKVCKQDIINQWIKPQISTNTPLDNLMRIFDNTFASTNKIGNYPKSDCRSALSSFGKFLYGYYKANDYINIDSSFSEAACKLVAQNAIFCTVDVANAVKNGEVGAKININLRTINGVQVKGNEYYSWFCCYYQRAKNGQKRCSTISIPSGNIDPFGQGKYQLDDNVKAGLAIKTAIIKGLPSWLKGSYTDFEDYMACHIWDLTCYDYRYHTSVFNIVLLPKAIAGLSDHYQEVKELLQYEAAMRFGVYPVTCSKPECPKNYKKVEDYWRQSNEHARINKNLKIKGI